MDSSRLDIKGDPPIPVSLRVSTRARRLSLRVSRLDGRVTLTLPRGVSRREAQRFLEEKQDWVRHHLADQPDRVRPAPGGSILFEGRDTPLVAVPGGRAARLGTGDLAGTILLPDDAPDKAGPRLAALFKTLARDRLASASSAHAARLGREITGLTLRDTRSRWGSCSSEGRLMFSWRLIMAPPEVLDYVAAHEAAHLVRMDHSPAFWAQVERLMPGYRPHRAWLRTHGADLHRYRFTD